MSSLTRHLRESGDHGALAFHPGCPVCRDERLLGTLNQGQLVPRRAQATLAAGVLALSAVGPIPTAVAQGEPPSEQEGQAAPEDPGTSGDSSQSPDFDPGGPDTDLPGPVGPEDPGGDSDAPQPLEAEPQVDPGLAPEPPSGLDTPTEVPPAPDSNGLSAPEVAVPPAPTPQMPSAPTPAPAQPAPATPTEPTPAPVATPDPPDATWRADRERDPKAGRLGEDPQQDSSVPISAPAPSDTVVTVAVEDESAATPVAAVAAPSARVEPGARVYVVQRGESLWSIARAIVGADASIASVARKVSRIWELNRERIGTGDPDLIMPGTRLRLR